MSSLVVRTNIYLYTHTYIYIYTHICTYIYIYIRKMSTLNPGQEEGFDFEGFGRYGIFLLGLSVLGPIMVSSLLLQLAPDLEALSLGFWV